MKITEARRLLSLNIKEMSLEQLQRHKVKMIDAWRHSKAQYGYIEAIKNGFYKMMVDSGASGYTPSDIWLTHQINNRLDEIEEQINKILKGDTK